MVESLLAIESHFKVCNRQRSLSYMPSSFLYHRKETRASNQIKFSNIVTKATNLQTNMITHTTAKMRKTMENCKMKLFQSQRN